MKAFKVEGVDQEAGTVVVEIDKGVLAPVANTLIRVEQRGHTKVHLAIRSLGYQLRNAAAVLYGERSAEDFGLVELEPSDVDEVDEEVRAAG